MPCAMTTFEFTRQTFEGFYRMFECERCNQCEESIDKIYLTNHDVSKLASHLHMTQGQFLEQYTFKQDDKVFMPAPCPFYDNGCLIHDFSPEVCIQFPFNQPVKCGDKWMLTINEGCPAGKKMAEKFVVKV